MRKIAAYCLQALAIVGIASLTSCGKSDTVTPTSDPTITSVADPASGYKMDGGVYKFEKGDKVKVKIDANVPGGVQIFQVYKKVGSGTDTDVSSAYSGQAPAAGATAYNKVFELSVSETYNATTAAENVVTFTFKVRNSQMTAGTFKTSTFTFNVAPQGQGGGGGLALLLRASATVTLGSQASSSPSYVVSQSLSTGTTNGLYSTSQVQALSATAKKTVDLTFGIVNTSGNAATGADATDPRLVSPSQRKTKGFTDVFDNDVNASKTTFAATTLTSLSAVTASNVNNDIDHSAVTAESITIQAGKVYSFKNAQGAKGYILIKTLTGTQDNRDAQIEVLVQQLQ